jgi:hypothetical protein
MFQMMIHSFHTNLMPMPLTYSIISQEEPKRNFHGYTSDSRDANESDIGQKRLHKFHANVQLTYYFLGATKEKLLTATPVTAGTHMSQTLARSCHINLVPLSH